jgi:hypothetical protein
MNWFRHKCGDCDSSRLLRSRRRSWKERIVSLVLLPWCCEKCGWRGYKVRNLKVHKA